MSAKTKQYILPSLIALCSGFFNCINSESPDVKFLGDNWSFTPCELKGDSFDCPKNKAINNLAPMIWERYRHQLKDYDGYGEYLVSVRFNDQERVAFGNETLAFYMECVDDAADVYYRLCKNETECTDQEQLLGHAGSLPPDFRAATREAQLYPFPFSIKDTTRLLLRVLVYDFSGNGGIACNDVVPKIGTYHNLEVEKTKFILRNDILRIVFLTVACLGIGFCGWRIVRTITNSDNGHDKISLIAAVLRYFALPFRFFTVRLEITKWPKSVMVLRDCLYAIFLIGATLFLFSEINYKYVVLPFIPESFYFKIPAVSFATAMVAMQVSLQLDVFSRCYGTKFSFLERLVMVFTSPWVGIIFVGYLSFVSPQQAWQDLTTVGLVFLFFQNFTLALAFLYQLVAKSPTGADLNTLKEVIRAQKKWVLGLLFFMLVGILIFLLGGAFFTYSFLIMLAFSALFILYSTATRQTGLPIDLLEHSLNDVEITLKRLESEIEKKSSAETHGPVFLNQQKIIADLNVQIERFRAAQDLNRVRELLVGWLSGKAPEYIVVVKHSKLKLPTDLIDLVLLPLMNPRTNMTLQSTLKYHNVALTPETVANKLSKCVYNNQATGLHKVFKYANGPLPVTKWAELRALVGYLASEARNSLFLKKPSV